METYTTFIFLEFYSFVIWPIFKKRSISETTINEFGIGNRELISRRQHARGRATPNTILGGQS